MNDIEAKARQDMIAYLMQQDVLTDEQLKNLEELATNYSSYIKQSGLDKPDMQVDAGFMKNDSGKNMLSLIDPAFIVLLGEILTFGANKYAPNNWQKCKDLSRYKDALLRHIYAYLSGEQVDPESGLSHLGHAAFGLMCLNYFDNLNIKETTCQ